MERVGVAHGGGENGGQDLDSLDWQVSDGPFEKAASEPRPEYREGSQT